MSRFLVAARAALLSAALVFTFPTVSLSACGGDASGGGPSEQTIVALCDTLLAELEQAATPDERAVFVEAATYVSGFDYSKADTAGGGGGKADAPVVRPATEAALYQQLSLFAGISGREAGALWMSLQAVKRAPSEVDLLLQAGALLESRRDCPRAEQFLLRARQLAPDNGLVRLALARSLYCQGQPKRGAEEASEAAKREKGSMVVERALTKLYLEQQPELPPLEAKLQAVCAAELKDAAKTRTPEVYAGWAMGKLAEVSALGLALLTAPQPADAPPQLTLDVIDAHDAFDLEHDAIDKTREGTLDGALAKAEKQHKSLHDAAAACQAPSPTPKCSCYRNLCVQGWKLVSYDLSPPSMSAAKTYLLGAIPLLDRFKNKVFNVVSSYGPELSAANRAWAYDYVYKVGEMYCKTIAVSYASTTQVPTAFQKLVDLDCAQARQICDASEQAELEAARQKEEQSFKESLAKAEEEARAMQQGKTKQPKGEVCFIVGCIGFNGDTISLKVGAGKFLYTQLSVDTKTYTTEVRVGAGISSPLGANTGGLDISIGGKVGASGTEVNLQGSASALLGTQNETYTLWSMSSKR